MDYQNLLLQQESSILTITINRENKLNALDKLTLSELHAAFSEAFANADTRGIIITGAGSKAFAAGADIAGLKDLNANEGTAHSRDAHIRVFDFIENGPKPVIAAINGYALGGGLELAMACHIRIAANHARMGLPELSLGLIPGYGGTRRLPALVGKGRALEMILSSEMIDADRAYETGLVNRVTEPETLLAVCREVMHKILKNPASAIAAAIRTVNAAANSEDGECEINEFGALFDTSGFKEGVAAFLEKRKPSF